MKILRLLLSVAMATYMTGAGRFAFAQDAGTSPYSITLAPLQYANVKGNVGKFEALNWMSNGETAGVSDMSFIKEINKSKDISVWAEGSVYPGIDTGDGHLTLKDGDLAFLKIDYNAFRKWYDGTGGVDYNSVGTFGHIPASAQAAQPNSPDLQVDISYFKLETGLGPITDPYLDVTYEHDSKDGAKSLEQWASAYAGAGTSAGASGNEAMRKIAPSWESLNNYTDTLTVREKKEIAGITIKGEQKVEVDYNHNIQYMQQLNDHISGALNELDTYNDSPDAKLFGAGVRFEKWMLNDNTFAALGYHYNHTHATDLNQRQVIESVSGVIQPVISSSATLWNTSHTSENDHVWVGNINSNLTPNLVFVADTRYEHMGSEGSSTYYTNNAAPVGVTASDTDIANMENREDHEGEHVALRYYGLPHTTLYVESEFEQERNQVNYLYTDLTSPATTNFTLDRIDRTQNGSWTVGGRMVPNRFFIFSTQVKAHWSENKYDTVSHSGSTGDILLDALNENGVDETSTLTWKPYRWLQNSIKYQFSDTVYRPQPSLLGPSVSSYGISENHMLSSQFTYDITVQPIDPLLMMLSYSHVESYTRTLQASQSQSNGSYVPTFNSGDNSWLFSVSYFPTENLSWTNTASYTISNNYVDFTSGLPLGSDFKMINFSTGLDYTYHKWLKVGPKYEYAAYRDNPSSGSGNYSANIFMLTTKFSW